MPARIPVLDKSPFALDPRPLEEMGSAHAGILATSRALRSLHLGGLVAANLPLKNRQRGFSEGQMIESLVLLQTLGGDGPEDISLLAEDPCLVRGLGYEPPKASAARTFLNRFHDDVNAAWFTIALLAYNTASAIKSLCLEGEERTARFKRYRLLVIEIAGRMSRSQCKLRLRLHATPKTIGRIQKIWEVFDLPTQATAFS